MPSLFPVAILAGGLAKRLRPLTESIPKALIDIEGEPFLAHQLRLLRERGIDRAVVCAGHLGEKIRAAIGDGRDRGIRVEYSFDGPTLLGTAGAIRKALPLLGSSFFVLYGDSYLECDYGAVESAFTASGRESLMTVYRNEDRGDRSNVVLSEGRIVAYDKGNRRPEMRWIDYGLGMFRRPAFDAVPDGIPFDLADLYRMLLARGELAGFEVRERFFEIGSPAGLEDLRAHLRRPR